VEARGEAELEQAFAVMAAERVDGLFGISDSTLVGNTQTLKRIVELKAAGALGLTLPPSVLLGADEVIE
jgi:hypothetical protein